MNTEIKDSFASAEGVGWVSFPMLLDESKMFSSYFDVTVDGRDVGAIGNDTAARVRRYPSARFIAGEFRASPIPDEPTLFIAQD